MNHPTRTAPTPDNAAAPTAASPASSASSSDWSVNLRWRTDQLPPPVHLMRTHTRHRLAVRLIRPGDAYANTARLNGTALVEVRRWDHIHEAIQDPGDVLAVWDLTLLLEEPRAVWHLFTAGFPYAVPDGALEGMYAAVHAAAIRGQSATDGADE